MKKQIITIAFSVVITLAIVFGVMAGIYFFREDTVVWSYPEDVRLIQLIATPEKYDGKLVRVIAVGNLEFEGNYLSLSKEDWKYRAGNTVWIQLDPESSRYQQGQEYNGKYVIIEGIFDKDNRGHMSSHYGAIRDVRRYQLWEEPEFIRE